MSSQVVIPEEELPNWMKRARRGFDWGVLLVIGFSILIAWPFIENPGLPRTNDSIHYAFQVHDTAQALLEGRLYPRWSPYALNGIGAPIAHYTPPFSAHVTALTEILFTNNTIIALRVIHVVSIIFAGLAVYALVMQRVNGIAGLLSALLYVYSPYLSLTVPHVLGDLRQAIVLALLPMLLWTVHRLLHRNQAMDVLFVAIVTSFIVLTSPKHIILGILLSGLLLILHVMDKREWQPVHATMLAMLCGVGLAACYWLPAYLERGLVQWLPVSTTPRPDMLTLTDLFKRTVQLDTGLLHPSPTFNLGWGLLTFLIISIGHLILRRGTRFHLVFILCGFGLLLIGLTILSSTTWLMGGVVLCFSIGSSVVGKYIMTTDDIVHYALVSLLMVIVFLIALPIWLSQPAQVTIGNVEPGDQIAYELEAGTIALLPADAYYPTTIPYADVEQNLDTSLPFDNINRFRNINSAQLTLIESGTHYARYTLIASEETSVDYNQAYFAGWTATVDGERIPLSADPDTLTTTLDVPIANNSTLTIVFGTTASRVAAWILTYVILAFVIGWVWQRWQTLEETFDEGHLIPINSVRLLIIILAIGISGRTVPEIRDAIYQLRQPATYQIANRIPMFNEVNDGHLVFAGYDLSDEAFRAGDRLSLTLYWQAIREASDLYHVSIEVYDSENDVIFYSSDKHPPGFYATSLWSPHLFVHDTFELTLPDDLPEGTHFILVRLWRCDAEMVCDEPVSFTQTQFGVPISFMVTTAVNEQ